MQKSGMVILINGVCGVGKSTVARSLCKLLQDKNFIRLDGDEYVIEHRTKPPESMTYIGKWHVDIIGKAIVGLLESHNVIVSDTFVFSEEIDFLSELQKSGMKVIHIILDAEKLTVAQRTLADRKHAYAKDWRLKTYVPNMLSLRFNFPDAVHVVTDGRTVAEIVSEIYDKISVSL